MSSICVNIVSDREVGSEQEIDTYREVDRKSLFVGLILSPIIVLIAVLPWVLFGGSPPWWLLIFCMIWCCVLAFFPLSSLRRYIISRLPTAWQFGWSSKGVWCRFRRASLGCRNSDLDSFAYIPAENIDWIRVLDKSQERTMNVSLQNGGKYQKFIEIGLRKLDISALREVLKAEKIRQRSQISFQGALLDLTDEGTLIAALENPEQVAEGLKQHFNVLEAKITRRKKFREMTNDEKRSYIMSLAENGDKVAAVRATSEGFKCTLTEANRFVDGLMTGQDNIPLPLGARPTQSDR